MMTTFTHKHKIACLAAFSRGWRKAMDDEQTWKHLDNKARAQFIRSKVREEIYDLPSKKSIWERLINAIS